MIQKAKWQSNKIAAGIVEKMGAIEAHPVMAFKALENDVFCSFFLVVKLMHSDLFLTQKYFIYTMSTSGLAFGAVL